MTIVLSKDIQNICNICSLVQWFSNVFTQRTTTFDHLIIFYFVPHLVGLLLLDVLLQKVHKPHDQNSY